VVDAPEFQWERFLEIVEQIELDPVEEAIEKSTVEHLYRILYNDTEHSRGLIEVYAEYVHKSPNLIIHESSAFHCRLKFNDFNFRVSDISMVSPGAFEVHLEVSQMNCHRQFEIHPEQLHMRDETNV